MERHSLDLLAAAKYPFLKDSARYLRETGVNLDQLVSGMAYERARYQGKERVMEVLDEGIVGDHPMVSAVDATTELLSYPVARMIVSAVADKDFVRRYAIAEAKKANRRLREENIEFVKLVADEFGLPVSKADDSLAVDFADFLRFSAVMRSRAWKLVNQSLFEGKVLISKNRLARLVEQSLTDKIVSELPLPVNDSILNAFGPYIEEIRGILEQRRAEHRAADMGRLSIVRFPPCMKKLLDMIRAGENVPHSGRFALVAFLHTLGMDSNEILETFSTAPDFDESKSRYQIDHITGEISGTVYTPPECSTMKSYGICYNPDAFCKVERINHPLNYYKKKGRRFRSAK